MRKVTDAPPLSSIPSSPSAPMREVTPAQAPLDANSAGLVAPNDADVDVDDIPQWAAVGAGPRKSVDVAAQAPVAAVSTPLPAANVAPGDAMASAMQTIADFFGEPKLAKDADALRTAKPEKLQKVSTAFEKHLAKVRDEYSKLKNDPSKQAEFEKHFGALDGQLSAVGMTADDLFNAATTGPQHLAERITGARSPAEAATFTKVSALIERVSDENLKPAQAQAANDLSPGNDSYAKSMRVVKGLDASITQLISGLKTMADTGEITPSQQQQYLDYGLSRLNAIRSSAADGTEFPISSTVKIGSAEWKSQMDALLPPERTNQTLEVVADGDARQLTRVIDEADSKLFVSFKKVDPNRHELPLEDPLPMSVRQAQGDLTSLAMINRIAAKKLEMPFSDYLELRTGQKLEAKDIRDLRMAQKQLETESDTGTAPDILSKEVATRAAELKKLPESQRREMSRTMFTHCDVKVMLDSKFPQMAMLGQLEGMVSLAVTHAPITWMRGLIEPQALSDARRATTGAPDKSDLVEALEAPAASIIRDVEDKVSFATHPLRFMFGAPRDLEDLGIDVNYENPIIDKKGLHPTAFMHTESEAVVLGKRADGTLSFVTTGNNVGGRRISQTDEDGTMHVRRHDTAVYSQGGKGSVAEDIARYETQDHWNAVAEPEKAISADDVQSWQSSSDATVGDAKARMLTTVPGKSRSETAAVMAGFASADKRIVVFSPHFNGQGFIDQAIAAADRWKRQGWDPNKPFDPNDPSAREFTVMVPGKLGPGVSQMSAFKAVNELKAHGIHVLQWQPAPGARTADGNGVYEHNATMETELCMFKNQDGTGFGVLGPIDLEKTGFNGGDRSLAVYSEDPKFLQSIDDDIVTPDKTNSIEAKNKNGLLLKLDQLGGFFGQFLH